MGDAGVFGCAECEALLRADVSLGAEVRAAIVRDGEAAAKAMLEDVLAEDHAEHVAARA